jgi:hypothetical protein
VSWTNLLNANRVAAEPTSKGELDRLRSIVLLRLSDVDARGLSDEQRFIIAYDAARTLSTMVVRASGYRPKKAGGHYNTFVALAVADAAFVQLSAYFNVCRMKRNESEYDFAGSITKAEADELTDAARRFVVEVEGWIAVRRPDLV